MFKVGDKVRVINTPYLLEGVANGDIGEVTSYFADLPFPVEAKVGNERSRPYLESELELVE